jgi:SAM-dependent methyltransferase
VTHEAGSDERSTTDDETNAAEFDTLAEWTAEAARVLGPDHFIPAACRGSGGPAALSWFLDRLQPAAGSLLLDVGAGVGGPGAFAAERTGARPLLAEPQPGACRAARRLFGLDVVQADAVALPVPNGSADTVWSLGVLDTLPDHVAFFAEIARCLRPSGAFGLLAYVAIGDVSAAPESNHFPTPEEMSALIEGAGLRPTDHTALAELGPAPDDWARRADAVDEEVARRHGGHPVWRQAHDQEQAIGELIGSGRVRGELFVLRPSAPSSAG